MVYNIQVARCIGMFIVLLYHGEDLLGHFYGTTPQMPHFLHGAIDTFFVASGFIMFHTTRHGKRTPYQFLSDRIIRVYPIYWMATTAFALLYIIGANPAFIAKIDLNDYFASMALFPDIRGDGNRAMIVEQGWTLIFEMYFYILFALCLFLGSQVRSLIALTLIFAAGPVILNYTTGLPMPLEYILRPITLEFVAGGVLALLYRQELPFPKQLAVAFGWALLIGGMIAMYVIGSRYVWAVWSDFFIRIIAFGIPATMVLAGLLMLEKGGARWTSKTMLFFGAASYATYIFHMFGLQYTLTAFYAIWPDANPAQMLIAYWTSVAVSTASCAALHVWVENPTTEFLKRVFRPDRFKKKAASPAAAA